MKIQTITVRYGEKRSMQYQSVDVAVDVTVTLEEGESLPKVVAQITKGLQARVAPEADRCIGDLISDMEAKYGKAR